MVAGPPGTPPKPEVARKRRDEERRGEAGPSRSASSLEGSIKRRLAQPPVDPERDAERERIENERQTIKAAQARLGVSRGPTPSMLPPTPDTLDPDR